MNTPDAWELYAWIIDRYPHCGVSRDSFVEDLEEIRADHAWAAAKALHRDGREFGPNGGKIIRRLVVAHIDAPEWYVVKAEIDRRRTRQGGATWSMSDRVCPLGECDGSGTIKPGDEDDRPKHELIARYCECREQMLDELAGATGIHPLVNDFIKVVGRTEILAMDSGLHNDEVRVQRKWEAFVADAEKAIAYTGIDTAGLPELERLKQQRENNSLGSRSPMEGLRKPSMTKHLQAPTTNDEQEAA